MAHCVAAQDACLPVTPQFHFKTRQGSCACASDFRATSIPVDHNGCRFRPLGLLRITVETDIAPRINIRDVFEPASQSLTDDILALDRHLVHSFADLAALKEEGARTVIAEADGAYVYDADGNRFLDGIGGLWCVNVGHGRREIIEAVDRLERMTTETLDFTRGAERLVLFVVAEREGADAAVLKRELGRRLAERLNPLFRIHDLRLVESLPRTASNKLMRRELRAAYNRGA